MTSAPSSLRIATRSQRVHTDRTKAICSRLCPPLQKVKVTFALLLDLGRNGDLDDLEYLNTNTMNKAVARNGVAFKFRGTLSTLTSDAGRARAGARRLSLARCAIRV